MPRYVPSAFLIYIVIYMTTTRPDFRGNISMENLYKLITASVLSTNGIHPAIQEKKRNPSGNSDIAP